MHISTDSNVNISNQSEIRFSLSKKINVQNTDVSMGHALKMTQTNKLGKAKGSACQAGPNRSKDRFRDMGQGGPKNQWPGSRNQAV